MINDICTGGGGPGATGWNGAETATSPIIVDDHVYVGFRLVVPKGRDPVFDLNEDERHHVPMIEPHAEFLERELQTVEASRFRMRATTRRCIIQRSSLNRSNSSSPQNHSSKARSSKSGGRTE